MVNVALPSILQPGVVNEIVSEVNVLNTRLQDFFIGGAGARDVGGRNFAWDVFNDTRNVATARAPGVGPARIKRNPVGRVTGVFPRVHESIPLLGEEIHNLRRLGGNPMDLDRGGESYILAQQRYLAQRLANHKEFQYAAMIRGSYFYTQNGDDINVSLTSGQIEVNYRVPAGNKNQLDILGAGNIIGASWATDSTDIPGHLGEIDAAMESLVGLPIRHAWLNSKTMNYILKNTAIKGLAGTANVVFDRFDRAQNNDFEIVLAGWPNITWHVTNGVLAIDGTKFKLLPDDAIMFCPDPDPSWIEHYNGSEPVVEYPGAPMVERFGSYFWAETTTKPAGYELIDVYNGLPALKVPNAILYADVTP